MIFIFPLIIFLLLFKIKNISAKNIVIVITFLFINVIILKYTLFLSSDSLFIITDKIFSIIFIIFGLTKGLIFLKKYSYK